MGILYQRGSSETSKWREEPLQFQKNLCGTHFCLAVRPSVGLSVSDFKCWMSKMIHHLNCSFTMFFFFFLMMSEIHCIFVFERGKKWPYSRLTPSLVTYSTIITLIKERNVELCWNFSCILTSCLHGCCFFFFLFFWFCVQFNFSFALWWVSLGELCAELFVNVLRGE